MSKERLEEIKHMIGMFDGDVEITLFGHKINSEYVMGEIKWLYQRVQELEKEFELCDSTIKKYYEDDCIHCNGKGFNGLDYCPNCVRGEVLQENLKLEQQNKRYREALEFYAEQDNYEWETSYRPQQEIDCMVIDDGGHTAREALEDEK